MPTNQPKRTLAPTCWSVLEEPGMTGKLQTFPALSKPRVPQDRLITKQRVRERNRDREQPSCCRCFLPHSGPLSGERKKKKQQFHSNRRARMHAPKPPTKRASSHLYFISSCKFGPPVYYLYLSFYQQKRDSVKHSHSQFLGTAQANPPSFLKQSRTRFRRAHWPTRSSPAGPVP